MSVKLEIYQAIKAKLEALAFLENVLHYNGQDTLDYEEDVSKRFPQAWIQLNTVNWGASELHPHQENRTQQQKSSEVVITIYYAVFSLNPDDDTFETDLVNIDLIYRAVTMTEGDNFNPLQRSSESDESNNNNVRVWAQEFTTMLTEPAIVSTDIDAAPVTITINKVILP
jgi:hypothetical protein